LQPIHRECLSKSCRLPSRTGLSGTGWLRETDD
jgi:hypothetical protein